MWYRSAQAETKTNNGLVGPEPWHLTLESQNDLYPAADRDAPVDGRAIREDIPNLSSIGSSLGSYTMLPGIRVLPMAAFPDAGEAPSPTSMAADRWQKVQNLAAQIQRSGELNPLIVVYDEQGPYVLEGNHRYDALRLLGATAFPAKVVIDEDALYKRVESALENSEEVPESVLDDYPDLKQKYGR